MRWKWVPVIAVFALLTSAVRASPVHAACTPTPGVAPANDVALGQCLFGSRTAFGQNPGSVFPSCSTCHYSGTAFQDRAVHFNILTNAQGKTLKVFRNTPSLFNAAESGPYGWDGRHATIQDQALDAIVNPLEMNGTGATGAQLDALAAFVRTITPPQSPYDLFIAGDTTALSPAAQNGMQIFLGKGTCSTCHAPPLFTNNTFQTNQVHATFSPKTDPGAGFFGNGPNYTFNVPQLRGIRLTAPYMHNGALGRLIQVVRFYNASFLLGLTEGEIGELVQFLESL